ncbi:uncharacterized protein LOC144316684 [Canis aureus]
MCGIRDYHPRLQRHCEGTPDWLWQELHIRHIQVGSRSPDGAKRKAKWAGPTRPRVPTRLHPQRYRNVPKPVSFPRAARRKRPGAQPGVGLRDGPAAIFSPPGGEASPARSPLCRPKGAGVPRTPEPPRLVHRVPTPPLRLQPRRRPALRQARAKFPPPRARAPEGRGHGAARPRGSAREVSAGTAGTPQVLARAWPGDRWISRGLDPEKRVLLQRARSGCLVNTQSRAVASRGRAGAGNSFVRIEDAYCSRSVDEAWAERRRSQCRGALTDTLCVGSSCRAQTGLSHLPGRSETDHCVLNEHLRCPWRVHPCGIQFISNLSGSIRGGFDSLCPGPVHKMCAAAHKVASHECHRNRVEGNTREKGFFPTQNFTCAKNYTDSHEDIPAVSVLPSVEENEIPSEVYNVIDSEEGLRDPLVFNDPYWPMQWELFSLTSSLPFQPGDLCNRSRNLKMEEGNACLSDDMQ